MRDFNLGVAVWVIGCLKGLVVCAGIYAFFKVAVIVKAAVIDSPFTMGMIALGVIALLALVIKVKRSF